MAYHTPTPEGPVRPGIARGAMCPEAFEIAVQMIENAFEANYSPAIYVDEDDVRHVYDPEPN